MKLYKNKAFCMVIVLAVILMLCSCHPGDRAFSTAAGGESSAPGAQAESITEAVNDGITENESTAVSNADSVCSEEKREKPDSTAASQAEYEEWTYTSISIPILYPSGNSVTYTENPDNQYIAAASKQLNIPADRLSASFYSKGATIFVFSSAVKNKASLTDCYILFSDTMKIDNNIRKDGSASGNKALADLLYDNAMKNKPR